MDPLSADQTIGRNLQSLRGARTQQELASRMRDAGLKWSQATVWAVEKGERPLRLAEALELTLILGVSLNDLLRLPEEVILRSQVKLFRDAEASLVSAAYSYEEEGRDLHQLADDLTRSGHGEMVREVMADVRTYTARDLLAGGTNAEAAMEEMVRLHAIELQTEQNQPDRERLGEKADRG